MIDLSFVICTYNSPHLIKRCVESILKQKYDGKIDILFIDGNSDKKTLDLLKQYTNNHKNIRLINNPAQLPEGEGKGKWLSWKNVKGKYIAMVDQDNELQGETWILEMLKPFENKDIFGVSCQTLVKKGDTLTNQYIALQGTDPALAYQSLDGQDLKKIAKDKGNYYVVELDKQFPLLTGGNCFIYRKDYLDAVGGYTKDTENIKKLIASGKDKIAIPKKTRTHHQAVEGFLSFIKKKKHWAKTYSQESKKKQNKESKFSYLPQNKEQRKKLIINLFFIATVFPNIFITFKQIIKTKQKAWILHPLLTLITTMIYSSCVLGGK